MAGTSTIPLTKGAVAIVDNDDYDFLVNMGRWHLSSTGYAVRRVLHNGQKMTVRMHRVICNTPDGLVVDHLNGDTLDNRKSNLRNVTQSVNTKNRHGARGYCWDKSKNMWMVRYKGKFYGRYRTESEAASAHRLALSGIEKPDRSNPRRKYLPRGVYYMLPLARKKRDAFYLRPTINGSRKFIGYFKTVSDALNALDSINNERRIAS